MKAIFFWPTVHHTAPLLERPTYKKKFYGQCGLALVRKIPSTDLTYSADSKHVINL